MRSPSPRFALTAIAASMIACSSISAAPPRDTSGDDAAAPDAGGPDAPPPTEDAGVEAGADAVADAAVWIDAAPIAAPLDVNDVSMLFPLPAFGDPTTSLLGFDAVGRGGVLFSRAQLATIMPKDVLPRAYEDWRIVAFRYDPCAVVRPGAIGAAAPEARCAAQLRLVAQPLSADSVGHFLSVADAGIHLTYALAPSIVASVERDLRVLKALSPATTNGQPLGVHPGLAAAGLDSPFARQVETFLRAYVGAPSLVRVTGRFLELPAIWELVGFDVADGALTPMVVAGTTGNQIDLTPATPASKIPASDDDGGTLHTNVADPLFPAPVGTDTAKLFLQGDTAIASASAAEFQSAVDMALRLDNPDRDDLFNADCASCHVASRGLARARALRGPIASNDSNAFVPPAGVTSSLPSPQAEQGADGAPDFTEAFGYHLSSSTPSFNARVVNESAKVAAAMNAKGP